MQESVTELGAEPESSKLNLPYLFEYKMTPQ